MINKEKLKNTAVGLFAVAVGIILLVQRENAAKGISRGLSVCADVLIPSLFPFMVLSAFCVKGGLSFSGLSPVGVFCRKILKMPCDCLTAVFFGFVGGYPVGASVISSLYEKGSADRKTARRLMSCCVNAGPAFVITATGTVMLGNPFSGILLFVSVCLASVISGILFSFIYKGNAAENEIHTNSMSLSDSLIGAVTDSCRNIVLMCGWVILFSSMSCVVTEFVPEKIVPFFLIFSEVTSGVEVARDAGGLPLVAACISSGGLCVMCQILPAIKKCGIKVYEYLLFRIVNSVFSFVITKIFLLFVDVSVSVGSFQTRVRSNSALSVAALCVMCAVFIFDISSHRTDKMTLSDIIG